MKKSPYTAHLLQPTTFALDGGAMFGIIPKPVWEKKIQPDELNRIDMSLRMVLIRSLKRNILIDTGIGNYHGDKFEKQFKIKDRVSMEQILEDEFSLKASDITDVVLTHLHFDHVGGLYCSEKNKSFFPNATVHLHKKHYEYALSPTARDSGSFQKNYFVPALSYHLENNLIQWLSDEESLIIQDGDFHLRFHTSHGHTPYMIHPYTDDFIYMADLVPMEHHIHIPWVMGYDIEPGTTTIHKERIYQFIQEKKLKMIFEHDKDTWGAHLTKNEKGKYISDQVSKTNTETLTLQII